MANAEILSRLPIKGAVVESLGEDSAGYLPILDEEGKLSSTVVPAVEGFASLTDDNVFEGENTFEDDVVLDESDLTMVDGLIFIADGTNGVPAIAFNEDPDTGIHRSWSGGIGLGVGGVLLLNLDADGLTSIKRVDSPGHYASGAASATAWGAAGVVFKSVAATYTDTTSSGTVANIAGSALAAPTFAASAATTYTTASTLYLGATPVAGTNATLSNSYALHVGTYARFDDYIALWGNNEAGIWPIGSTNNRGTRFTTSGTGDLEFVTTGGTVTVDTSGDLFVGTALVDTVPWVTKTTTYNAVTGDKIMADTNGAAFTITLPASPVAGDVIEFVDSRATWDTNNLTLDRNGNLINGAASNLVCDVENGRVTLIYQGASVGWLVQI